MLLPLLVVTVISAGGPHSRRPQPLAGTVVRITDKRGARHRVKTVRTGKDGRVSLRLTPGVYDIGAVLTEPKTTPSMQCETKVVRIAGRARRVSLSCSIR